MKDLDYFYISYSRRDQELVSQLSGDLRKSGINIWVDVQEISAGANWVELIQRALDGASGVIVVLSPDSVMSKWVETEVDFAQDHQKPIYPIVIRPVDLPLSLSNFQVINFSSSYSEGLSQLLQVLPKGMVSEEPIEPREEKSKGFFSSSK